MHSTTRQDGTAARRPGGPPDGTALEILVHGVGGSTPEEMLGDPRTVRVTGDATAAVYRRAEDAGAEQRPLEYAGRTVPEAYCWSGLTSGNGVRALWLFLLPFMVVNLAHWTRPSADGRSTAVRLHGLVVRLLALSLTVLLVAAACEVALDLLAWQCAGSAECTRGRAWLGFLAAGPEGGGWWSAPGRRLALMALVPAALAGLLWWLSHRTWSAYESQPPWEGRKTGAAPAAGDRPALCLPGFWYGRRHVARLRAAHTAAALLTVGAALAAATARYDTGPRGTAALETTGRLLQVLLAACFLWVLHTVVRRGRKERRRDDHLDRLTVSVLPGAAAGLLALTAVHATWSRPGWTSAGELPGNWTFGVLAAAQGLLVTVLAVTGLLLHRSTRVPRTALRGLGSACVAILACALGGVMSGGVAQRVADWLDGAGTPGDGDGPIPGPPTVLTWLASTIPVLLCVLLLILAVRLVRLLRTAGRIAATAHHRYPGARPDPSRSRRIGRTLAGAALTDEAPRFVGAAAVITLLLGLGAVLGAWLTGQVPGDAAAGTTPVLAGFAETAQALGSWLIGLGFVLFLTWGRRAYRDPAARRTIGILWDVGTFWPRAAHPFAPPCYAERAVPDLVWRMATWTQGQPGGRLVISGHSQGSVLAAAAVWQLDEVTRRQVALLTHGSPLERLYGRWFPAYFGPAQLRSLHHELDCWRNLWRETDPIGGPVRLPADGRPEVDRGPLLDPLAYGRTPLHPLPAPILGHGEYQADPAFAQERDALLARLCPGPVPAGEGRAGVPRPQRGAVPAQEPPPADTPGRSSA
jgi:hypothetical protein